MMDRDLIDPTLTCSENALRLGVSYRTVQSATKLHGITLPPAPRGRPIELGTEQRLKRIRRLRGKGCSHRAIGKAEGISGQAVARLCKRFEIQ